MIYPLLRNRDLKHPMGIPLCTKSMCKLMKGGLTMQKYYKADSNILKLTIKGTMALMIYG